MGTFVNSVENYIFAQVLIQNTTENTRMAGVILLACIMKYLLSVYNTFQTQRNLFHVRYKFMNNEQKSRMNLAEESIILKQSNRIMTMAAVTLAMLCSAVMLFPDETDSVEG